MSNTVRYGDLKKGDIIKWYGAKVRIVDISHENRMLNEVLMPCTYFTVEPYNAEAIEILGDFYSHGCYGGLDELKVVKVEI